jgi:hypothetical protein
MRLTRNCVVAATLQVQCTGNRKALVGVPDGFAQQASQTNLGDESYVDKGHK